MRLGFIFLLVGTLCLTSCSESHTELEQPLEGRSSTEQQQRQRNKYLAYEHKIYVTVPGSRLEDIYGEVIDECARDQNNQCVLLNSELQQHDRYGSASIELRVIPAGVDKYLEMVAKSGEVASQGTQVEDLGEAIYDNEKRLEMLKEYRQRLEQLERQTANDVDSAIKVASELASVQSDIEHAEGKNADLLQRTQMDIVKIHFNTNYNEFFWSPISEALEDFGDNLSEGISTLITATAYLLPWLAAVGLLTFAVRLAWRKAKSRP